jgi:hypothetical protein
VYIKQAKRGVNILPAILIMRKNKKIASDFEKNKLAVQFDAIQF